jgi:transcriptional regulator with PAS, ATPase and Fis domain
VRITTGPLVDASGRLVGFVESLAEARTTQDSHETLSEIAGIGNVIGMSSRMRELFRLIPVIAQTDSSILLTGETGTGKDVLAELIHEASERSEGAFVKINCGALPENLLESELFGHFKGAFTGAVTDKQGRLRLGHGGTVYLTEIGDLPLPLQVKLLTFLDDKVVYPLGGTSGFHTDVRVIAATHRNLEQMVASGEFRQDLLFRLNVVRLQIPSLREREGDVSLLLDHFRKIFSTRLGRPIGGFSKQVKQLLLAHDYPGNVRELRNIVEYASSICPAETIELEHLPPYLFDGDSPASPVVSQSIPNLIPTTRQNRQSPTEGQSWADIERQLIVEALVKTQGRRGAAAKLLGWGRSTLWRKIKQYEI